ncbi:type VII secretion protein EsaA [Bacillus sp. BRMEA1]|uniref:type VII secretion protein EsaA n=1 Tax=Neobacillus endophyticus TaxID=2738405 RepID=UPI001566C2E8|nr:type VII secretion protein EsaA [Neobacillus endophyticus]NRD77644.1 type VII secretion protein EsaA [Neobacillus endophyticus]
MKKFYQGIFLFVVLVLVLASVISYLALGQASKTKDDTENQKLNVALVNEDQGATYKGQKYQLGNEFITHIENDNKHNWYVVSRGVAENGMDHNVYNMMIVIPNDFSQKALSFDSKDPEKVELNYKVNPIANGNLKAEADQTANSILKDFNQRIIDVYFASVIGNLHDAQDNIQTLVNKEQKYTNLYRNSVYRPLGDYTSSLGDLQSGAVQSKGNFNSLQDVLKGFGTQLGENVKIGKSYQTGFLDFRNMQADNGQLTKGITDEMGDLDNGLNSEDVMQQWDDLVAANQAINNQFQQADQTVNILSASAALQDYLNQAKEKMGSWDADLANQLKADMQTSIADQLKTELAASSGKTNLVHLTDMFAKPDENVQKAIQNEIDQLPTLNKSSIDQLNISEQAKNRMKNIITVTNQYDREFDYSPSHIDNSLPLADQVAAKINSLVKNGITISDSINLPEAVNQEQVLTLSVPDEFAIKQVFLTLPNQKESDYSQTFLKNGKIVLPGTGQGNFTVKLKVYLKDANTKLDIFQPLTWSWDLVQKAGVSNQPSPAPASNATVNGSTSSQPTASAGTVNQHITHQVASPFLSNPTSGLLNGTIDSVSAYQKLQGIYELYFGIGDDQFDRPDLETQLAQTSLKNMAAEDSLYALFNKQDLADVLADYVAGQITEEVRQKTQDLKGKIDENLQLVDQANQSSAQMADLIVQTTEQAQKLNENISKSLDNLASWRMKSLKVMNDQSQIQATSDQEQSVVLSLDNDFKTLMTESQTLSDQSNANLKSADGVYQTVNAIGNRAEAIKNNGDDLLQEAKDLSSHLTNKLISDKNFATNFAGVLANSRVGQRQNENLLSFLSNPVETKNTGAAADAAEDVFTPYFMVLICFIAAFFTAYVFAGNDRKREQTDSFEAEQTTVKANLPFSLALAGTGIVEGIIIGFLSGYFLQIDQAKFIGWVSLITLVMLTMVLAAAYLLRQLKMVGMFVLLIMLSCYLFFTKALGTSFDEETFAAKIQFFSPLHYVEKLVSRFMNGGADYMLIVYSLFVISILSVIGHLFVSDRVAKNGENVADEITEAC